MRHLAEALDLEYSGELVSGVTTILVVAQSEGKSCPELLLGLKTRTAMQWGDIDIVRHQWLETVPSMAHCVTLKLTPCDTGPREGVVLNSSEEPSSWGIMQTRRGIDRHGPLFVMSAPNNI